jgi:threonine dehydrogenase-like Zn-dependent dehydrogenase
MRAARLIAPRKIVIEEARLPDPGARQVRIKIRGSGVCASNLGPWLGLPWLKYPLAPGEGGHEAWGVVDAVGSEVSTLAAGDHVAAVSYNAYAEYDVADEHAVVKVPGSLRAQVFPGEALGCAMNIFRRSRIERGQVVAILGIGFLGAVLTRLATSAGARVIAISRRPFALELARAMGADELVAMQDHREVVERVQALTDGKFCDRVVEAVGKQGPLDLAGELCKTHGLLAIAGYHQDGPRQVNLQLWNWRGLDVVNAHERETSVYARGIELAAQAIETQALDPTPLYTHFYPLERLDEALDATFERPVGFMKALCMP